MNRFQAKLILSHRDTSGNLDHNALLMEQRERDGQAETVDDFAELRLVRRLQGWPEYMIDKMLTMLEKAHATTSATAAAVTDTTAG